MVLIGISLMIRDVTCLWAICMPALEEYLFRFSAYFLIRLFDFLMLNCISCLYILTLNSLLVISFASILFHSVGCLFIFLFFCCVKAFNFKNVLSFFKYQLLESYNCCLISHFCFNYITGTVRSTMYILSHFTSDNIIPLPE